MQYIDGYYNGLAHWEELIPPQERHDVMLFDGFLETYTLYSSLETTPSMRFTYLTQNIMAVDPKIRTEVDDYFRHHDPLWILTSAESTYPLMQQKHTRCTLVAHDAHHCLYR